MHNEAFYHYLDGARWHVTENAPGATCETHEHIKCQHKYNCRIVKLNTLTRARKLCEEIKREEENAPSPNESLLLNQNLNIVESHSKD